MPGINTGGYRNPVKNVCRKTNARDIVKPLSREQLMDVYFRVCADPNSTAVQTSAALSRAMNAVTIVVIDDDETEVEE